MHENKYSILRLAGLIFTLIIFIAHYFIPDKLFLVHPSNLFSTQLYGYIHPFNGNSESWIHQDEHSMLCDYQPDNKYGCGFVVFKKSEFWKGLNLTRYDSISVDINYEGPSKIIRLYLRNYNETYSSRDDDDSTKFLSMIFNVNELGEHPINIKLSEFTVAEWWIQQRKTRRASANYEIDNIVNFGVDFIDPGMHKIRINNITLIGRYIKTRTLLIYILSFWMSIFVLEGILRFYTLYLKNQKEKSLINRLKDNQLRLEEEREKLKVLSSTDPLTGIYNRSGVSHRIQKLLHQSNTPLKFGVLLMDIDHFKDVNDRYGHDMGDKVLKNLTEIISKNMRKEDIFSRWGGEEFLMIIPNTNTKKLIQFAEKLRVNVEESIFSNKSNLKITISIGATVSKEMDDFEEAFKRADNALYQAKRNGRNRAVYEE